MLARFSRLFSSTSQTTTPAYEIASRFSKLQANRFTLAMFRETVLNRSEGTPFYDPQTNQRLADTISAIENQNKQLDSELKALAEQHPEIKFR